MDLTDEQAEQIAAELVKQLPDNLDDAMAVFDCMAKVLEQRMFAGDRLNYSFSNNPIGRPS